MWSRWPVGYDVPLFLRLGILQVLPFGHTYPKPGLGPRHEFRSQMCS